MSEGNEPRFIEQIKEASDEQCPVCGYYCLGKGGYGCIDKPRILEIQERRLAEISSFVDKAKLAVEVRRMSESKLEVVLDACEYEKLIADVKRLPASVKEGDVWHEVHEPKNCARCAQLDLASSILERLR